MPDEKWEEFKGHREAFKEAFKDEDVDSINCALQELPDNIRGDAPDNRSYRVNWDGCPLHEISCYYAHKMMDDEYDMPICGIDELKGRIAKL